MFIFDLISALALLDDAEGVEHSPAAQDAHREKGRLAMMQRPAFSLAGGPT